MVMQKLLGWLTNGTKTKATKGNDLPRPVETEDDINRIVEHPAVANSGPIPTAVTSLPSVVDTTQSALPVTPTDQSQKSKLTMKRQIWQRGREAWHADKWLQMRKQFVDSGNWDMVAELLSLAGHATSEVVKAGKYYLPPPDGQVSLIDIAGSNPKVQWYGASNVKVPDMELAGDDHPPLICAAKTTFDVASYLKKHFEHTRVCFAIEVSDFSAGGAKLRGVDSRNRMQQELFLRTDFQRFADQAAKQNSNGHSPMRNHLTAITDPFVFAARDVNIFRGSADEGYDFMAHPLQCDVVVSAKTCERPAVVRCKEGPENSRTTVLDSRGMPVEFFAEQDMFTSFLERLNLIGLVSLNDQGDPSDRKPVLVLTAMNLKHQPLYSIARALKHWRHTYASFFEGVVVACGDDKSAAEILDQEINGDIYNARSSQSLGECNTMLLNLSVNRELCALGNIPKTISTDIIPRNSEDMPRRGSRSFNVHDNLANAIEEMLAPPSKRRASSKEPVDLRHQSKKTGSSKERVAALVAAQLGTASTSTSTKAPSSSETPSVVEEKTAISSKQGIALPSLDGKSRHEKGDAEILKEVRSLALFVHNRLDLRRDPIDAVTCVKGVNGVGVVPNSEHIDRKVQKEIAGGLPRHLNMNLLRP